MEESGHWHPVATHRTDGGNSNLMGNTMTNNKKLKARASCTRC